MRNKRLLAACLLGLSAMLASGAATALAEYPKRPIKIITQAAPGAVIDLTTRQLAALLSQELGQPVLVVNQAGAGGNMATNALLAAKPDGYTLATTGLSPFGHNMYTLDVRYRLDDLAPISAVNGSALAMIALPGKGWNNVHDAFQAAKAEGRPLKAAVMDTQSRDLLEIIARQEGVELAPVPQTGGAPILVAVLGGHADIGIVGSIAVENAKSGKIVPLASVSSARFRDLPDVPTLKEQGYDVAYDSATILFASSKVPPEILDRLSQAMIKVGHTPQYRDMLAKLSIEPVELGREAAQAMVAAEHERAAALAGK